MKDVAFAMLIIFATGFVTGIITTMIVTRPIARVDRAFREGWNKGNEHALRDIAAELEKPE